MILILQFALDKEERKIEIQLKSNISGLTTLRGVHNVTSTLIIDSGYLVFTCARFNFC